MFYNLDGIPTKEPKIDKFWIQKFNDQVSLKEGDITIDIDFACVRLHDLLADKIFESREKYHSLLPSIPMWMVYGGIDSDIKISKEDFEKLIGKEENNEVLNKILYFFDCRNLISSLQNSVLETKYLIGQFYQFLNEDNFLLYPKPINATGTQFASGLIVTNIFSTINYFFISLYSQLDFMTKICFEFQNIATDFTKYPKLKCASILFGDSKRLTIAGMKDTLFEEAESIKTIMNIRHEIIHNASFDNMPKVYQVFKDSQIIEKFILLPDFKDGGINSFKNRKRFFDKEVKLNEIMPTLTIEFWKRLKLTLESVK